MRHSKSALKALILGSIVTMSMSGVAGAATTQIGEVAVDGTIVEPSTEGTTTTIGKEGSTISIGQYVPTATKDTYSLFLVGDQTVTLQGKSIDTSGMVAADGATVHVGGGHGHCNDYRQR